MASPGENGGRPSRPERLPPPPVPRPSTRLQHLPARRPLALATPAVSATRVPLASSDGLPELLDTAEYHSEPSAGAALWEGHASPATRAERARTRLPAATSDVTRQSERARAADREGDASPDPRYQRPWTGLPAEPRRAAHREANASPAPRAERARTGLSAAAREAFPQRGVARFNRVTSWLARCEELLDSGTPDEGEGACGLD